MNGRILDGAEALEVPHWRRVLPRNACGRMATVRYQQYSLTHLTDLHSGGPDARWPDRAAPALACPVVERRQRHVAACVATRVLSPQPLVTFLTHAELSPA